MRQLNTSLVLETCPLAVYHHYAKARGLPTGPKVPQPLGVNLSSRCPPFGVPGCSRRAELAVDLLRQVALSGDTPARARLAASKPPITSRTTKARPGELSWDQLKTIRSPARIWRRPWCRERPRRPSWLSHLEGNGYRVRLRWVISRSPASPLLSEERIQGQPAAARSARTMVTTSRTRQHF